MFSVSHGDIKSLFFWEFALIACFGAAIVLLIRWRCEIGPKKPKNLHMVLGHTIAGTIVFILPLFSQVMVRGWNIQGLIAVFAVFWLSLTEAYFFYQARPLFSSYLGTTLQRFWIGANVISLPAPVLLSILLFSPVYLDSSGRFGLVLSTSLLILFRSCLAACAYTHVTIKARQSRHAVNDTEGPVTKSTIDNSYPTLRNTASISAIESVALLALSVAANWCFGPEYVLVLGATTTASRSYVAYNYYEKNGPWLENTIEDAAVEDNSSSASLASIRELESVLPKRDAGPTQPSQPGASSITRQSSLISNNTSASCLEEEDVAIGGLKEPWTVVVETTVTTRIEEYGYLTPPTTPTPPITPTNSVATESPITTTNDDYHGGDRGYSATGDQRYTGVHPLFENGDAGSRRTWSDLE